MINWKLLKIFCLVLGVVSLIFALTVFSGSVGYYESSKSYGGDAYTGIQNAAAQSANNILYLGETIRTALGAFLLVQGLCLLLGGLCIRKAPKETLVQPMYAQPQPVQPMYAQPQPVQPVQPAQPVFQQAQPTLWACPRCGNTNAAEHRFCQNCGNAKP